MGLAIEHNAAACQSASVVAPYQMVSPADLPDVAHEQEAAAGGNGIAE